MKLRDDAVRDSDPVAALTPTLYFYYAEKCHFASAGTNVSETVHTLMRKNTTLLVFHTNIPEDHEVIASQVMLEAYRRDAISKEQLISELKSTKTRLVAEVKDLKQELLDAQGDKQKAELEQARLQKEVVRVQEQMSNMEAHLQAIQSERDQLETQIQVIIWSVIS